MKWVFKIVLCTSLMSAVIIAAIFYGNDVKNTYVYDVDFTMRLRDPDLEVMYDCYPYDEKYDIYGDGENIQRYEDLEEQSDLIVKGYLAGSYPREEYVGCILSYLRISEAIKGDAKEGDTIGVFEPVDPTGMPGYLLAGDGYSPMTDGTEYILYLKGYRNIRFGKGDYVYIPVSLRYGKYNMDQGILKRFKESEFSDMNAVRYSNWKDCEIFLYDKEEFSTYARFRNECLKRYG